MNKTIIIILSLVVMVIPAMAQEDTCEEVEVEIESTGNLTWSSCFYDKYTSMLINASSNEPTNNKIIIQKDMFWNYNLDCSPTRFFTLVNNEEIFQKEQYFSNYRILSVPLEKGDNKIEIVQAFIPGTSGNNHCSNNDNSQPSLKQQIENNIPSHEINCRNEQHYVFDRPNGKLACVEFSTGEKLGWQIVPDY